MYKVHSKGAQHCTLITEYYFKLLMDDTIKYSSKWSVNQVLESDECLSYAVWRTMQNDKVFDCSTTKGNLTKVFNLGGSGFAAKVANFPLKVVDQILYNYNTNGNWYDFSCGWGNRMIGALRNRVNYYGTDPNYKLAEKLNECSAEYKATTKATTETKIYCQGSETYIPELENKIGVAFSSPPYFSLEDYRYGNQSWNEILHMTSGWIII